MQIYNAPVFQSPAAFHCFFSYLCISKKAQKVKSKWINLFFFNMGNTQNDLKAFEKNSNHEKISSNISDLKSVEKKRY